MVETWVDIKDFEGYYQISDKGRVKSIKREITDSRGRCYTLKERIRKLVYDKDGYLLCSLSKNNKLTMSKVHRLVGKMFIPNPNNLPQINHKDDDKTNNNKYNLEWSNNRGNQTHKYREHNLPVGVTITNSGKYRTRITIERVQYLLYNGQCLNEAKISYDTALKNWNTSKQLPINFIKKYESNRGNK